MAQDDLDDSDGEPLFEDPRQHAWSGFPQDLREVPKHEVVEALWRSLVRAATGPELKFRAGAETTAGELASRRSSQRSSTREEDCRIGCDWGDVSDGGD